MIPVLVHGVSIKKTIPIKPMVKSKVSTCLTSSYNIFILSSFLIVLGAFTPMGVKNLCDFFYAFPLPFYYFLFRFFFFIIFILLLFWYYLLNTIYFGLF